MNSWVQSALKSILRGPPIFESAAWFFVIIVKFFFTFIFEIKIHEKKIMDTKKFHVRIQIGLTNPFRQPRRYLTPTAWDLIIMELIIIKYEVIKSRILL